MEVPIKSIADLQAEIIRLEKARQTQEIVLKKRFESPSAILATVKSIMPKNAHAMSGKAASQGIASTLFSQDILGLISRVVLPFTLNKTLFKNSGFIVKTLVSILSQKASTYISEDNVTTGWGRVKSLFSKKPGTALKPATVKPAGSTPTLIGTPSGL